MKSIADDEGAPLYGGNRYALHFEAGEMPLFTEKGFWSITAYATDNFF